MSAKKRIRKKEKRSFKVIKKAFYIALSFFFVFTFSTLLTYLFYPQLFDINFYKDDIEKELEEVLGLPLSIGKMDFSVKQGLGFEVSGLKSKGKYESGLDIKKAVIIIKILPLITNREVVLKKLELYSPQIGIKRNREGNWQFAGVSETDSQLFDIKSITEGLIKGHLWIYDGKVHLVDEWISDTPFYADADEINLKVMPSLIGEKLAISFGFKVASEDGNLTDINIDGKINNLKKLDDLERVTFNSNLKIVSLSTKTFYPYLRHYIPSLDADFTVNIDSSLHRDKDGKSGAYGKVERVRSKEVALSQLEEVKKFTLFYEIEGEKSDLVIKNLKLEFDGDEIKANGTITDLYSKDPLITATLSSSFIPIEKIKSSYLFSKVPEKFKNIANEHISAGSIKLEDFGYAGKWSSLTDTDSTEAIRHIKGALSIDKAWLTNIEQYEEIRNLNGNLEFKNGDLLLSKFNLNYKDSKLETLSGIVKDLAAPKEVDVELSAHFDFRQFNDLFQNILPAEYSTKIANPVGVAGINMKFSGAPDNSETYKYSGDIKITNGAFLYDDISLPVKKINGMLSFSQDHLESKKVDFFMGKSLFTVDGILTDLASENPDLNINISTSMVGNSFFEKVLKSDVINLEEGKITGSINIKGKELYEFSGGVNLSDASVKYGKLLKKDKGTINNVLAKGYLIDKYIAFDALNLTIDRSKFFVEGSFPIEKKLPFVMAVKAINVKPQHLLGFIDGVKEAKKGVIGGELYVIGENSDASNLLLFGGVKIKNSSLLFKDLPVENIDGKITFSGDRAMVESVKFKFDGNEIKTSGVMTGFKNPIIGFKIDAESFNLDHLFPETEEKEEEVAKKSEEASKTNIAGTVLLKKGSYRNLSFEDVKMNLFIDAKGVHSDPFALKGLGGSFSGKWEYIYEEPSIFSIEGDFKDINIKEMDERLDLKLTELEGTGDAKVKLSGIAGETKKFKKSMNGDISLYLRDGKVHRLKVLSSIFSIVNLSMPELLTKGTSYKTFKGDVIIKNGIASTTNFLLDSNAFRMTGVGDIDVGDSKIDMVVGVQPFQAIDKVISNIPIVGRVITGDEKAVITSYYSVKGDLEEPDVSSMHVKSLGKGIFGIFKRLFTLPKDLIQGKM